MFYKEGFFNDDIRSYDPILSKFIDQELIRQQNQIELIASENIVSKSVLQAQGSVLTNKYAEGLPGKRYYGGCEFVDEVEKLAIDRAKKLFSANFFLALAFSSNKFFSAKIFLALRTRRTTNQTKYKLEVGFLWPPALDVADIHLSYV